MSDDTTVKSEPATLDAFSAPKEPGRKSLFGNLNSELKQALNTWDVLTETMANKVSPEQEQLREVKKLLGDLKAKLAQFED
ncbi:MAG: hypothetical protein J7501_13580 [Bdellovibrio sp.]|nr:hypothetical protein [Bdellovibrio sp.]